MDEKLEFATRLKAAMVAAGYEPKPAVLEKQFNSRYLGRSVTFQAARGWLIGRSIPSQEKLQVLAAWLKVEPQELRYGTTAVGNVRERPLQSQWGPGVAHAEREVFEAFLGLPVAQQKIVREVVLTFARVYPPAQDKG